MNQESLSDFIAMQVKENFSLRQLNTFGIDVKANYFLELGSMDEINEFVTNSSFKHLPLLILGGGSNILFTKNFEGVVAKINTKGISISNETDDTVCVTAQAGVVWNDLVDFCVEKNFGGLENLALIPGSVGASPIQNIGAYGVEMKDTFVQLEAIDLNHQSIRTFSNADCKLDYRYSIFKQEQKNKFIILSVTFKLNKNPVVNISYGAIRHELEATGVKTITILHVRDAVCRIRKNKLPDPLLIGNAGSFFKNPYVSVKQYEELKNTFSKIVAYKTGSNCYKLAAGWLIEQCGWKGRRMGDAGVHQHQALVLVNHGEATGNEILALAEQIQYSVYKKFGVKIESEVNII